MKRSMMTAGVISAGILLLTSAAMAADIKEGEWTMTMVFQTEGMDEQMAEAQKEMENMSEEERAMMQNMMGNMGINMGAEGGGMSLTMNQCLTNDNPVPEASDEEDCQTTHSIDGNTVTFETICEDSHSTGELTYTRQSMQGTINTVTTKNGTEEHSTININGEYVGPCNENSAGAVNLNSQRISERELQLKQQELELKARELELRAMEMEMEQGSAEEEAPQKSSKKTKPTLNDVNSAVSTTNNVKNTFSGVKNLFGN